MKNLLIRDLNKILQEARNNLYTDNRMKVIETREEVDRLWLGYEKTASDIKQLICDIEGS